MRTIFGTLLALLLSWTPAAARQIFVDSQAGDDRATGEHFGASVDKTGPVRTIAKALAMAHGGDAIILARHSGPYHEGISLVGSRYSGALQPFEIHGNGAILDGTLPVPPAAWAPYEGPVFRFRPRLAGYQELYLGGQPADRVFAPMAARRPPDLKPRQWCLLAGRIYFCVDKGKLPADYRLRASAQMTGITLFHVSRVVISDLIVQGFQLDGISAFNDARRIVLAGVTCRGNGRNGITVGGASSVEIGGSLLGDNGAAQLLTLPDGQTRLQGTSLLSNTAPGWVDQGGRVSINGKPVRGGLDRLAPAARGAVAMNPEAVGRPMEILLVEDDLEDAGMTIEALRHGDVPCRVSLVRDGEEAVEFLFRRQRYRRAPRPDLILLDLNLPKKSGRDVLAEVRADETLVRLPVVVLTSSETHREILEAEHLRVEEYLVKPVEFQRFSAVVKALRRYMLSDVILPP